MTKFFKKRLFAFLAVTLVLMSFGTVGAFALTGCATPDETLAYNTDITVGDSINDEFFNYEYGYMPKKAVESHDTDNMKFMDSASMFDDNDLASLVQKYDSVFARHDTIFVWYSENSYIGDEAWQTRMAELAKSFKTQNNSVFVIGVNMDTRYAWLSYNTLDRNYNLSDSWCDDAVNNNTSYLKEYNFYGFADAICQKAVDKYKTPADMTVGILITALLVGAVVWAIVFGLLKIKHGLANRRTDVRVYAKGGISVNKGTEKFLGERTERHYSPQSSGGSSGGGGGGGGSSSGGGGGHF